MTKIVNVNAVSLDGYISLKRYETDSERITYGLSSLADQQHLKQLLMGSSAVITGSTSLVSAGRTWGIQNTRGDLVEWYVFTNKGLPESLPFWSEAGPRTLVTSRFHGISSEQEDFALQHGVSVFYYENDPARELYAHLKSKKLDQVLLFGGGQINQLFFAAKLVFGVELTICPVILGSTEASKYVVADLPSPTKLKLITSQAKGDHVFLSYRIEE